MATQTQTETIQPLDPVEVAEAAGLRYVHDTTMRGIRRKRTDDGFEYIAPNGKVIEDEKELARIKRLAIPPAWEDVWICPNRNGHIQATGRDARGRKQYRYHESWRRVRDEAKYDRVVQFGKALPMIRERVEHDLALPGLPKNKVLAAVVRLLELTLSRIGNESYARENDTYGLTTIREEHVEVQGTRIRLEFNGKGSAEHVIDLRDRRLANLIHKMQDLPGQELFTYLDDDGQPRDVSSSDVNDYLREITERDFTAKDFRTFAGTVHAAIELRAVGGYTSQAQAKRNVKTAIEAVAGRLRNTVAVCRKCYVHPGIIDAYLDLSLMKIDDWPSADETPIPGLTADEAAVLAFLEARANGN